MGVVRAWLPPGGSWPSHQSPERALSRVASDAIYFALDRARSGDYPSRVNHPEAIALITVAILIVVGIVAFTLPPASALEPTDPVRPVIPDPNRNTCRHAIAVGVTPCVTVTND